MTFEHGSTHKNCSGKCLPHPGHVLCTLDVPADFSNDDIFYLSYLRRAQNDEKVGTGTTSQHVTGTSTQIHLCKSNGSPQVAQMSLSPKLDTELELRRKGNSDLQNVHQHTKTGCF